MAGMLGPGPAGVNAGSRGCGPAHSVAPPRPKVANDSFGTCEVPDESFAARAGVLARDRPAAARVVIVSARRGARRTARRRLRRRTIEPGECGIGWETRRAPVRSI